jgi:hypothetical protein
MIKLLDETGWDFNRLPALMVAPLDARRLDWFKME